MSEWIRVEDRLPGRGMLVLVANSRHPTKEPPIRIGMLNRDSSAWWAESECGRLVCNLDDITHWQPLPDPPEVTR